MSHVVLVTFRARPGQELALRDRLRQQATDTLQQEPACRVFDVCADPVDPAETLLYEVYDAESAFETHLTTDHFLAFDAATRELVEAKTVRHLSRLPA